MTRMEIASWTAVGLTAAALLFGLLLSIAHHMA